MPREPEMTESLTNSNSPPQDVPAGFIVPPAFLRLLGLLSLFPCIGTLAITASFIERGPTDRSGVIPAFLLAVIFGFSAFAALSAARRNVASNGNSASRMSPRRVFWFRVVLFPFFAATTTGAIINGWQLFHLLNAEYLQWFVWRRVEIIIEPSTGTRMIESGIACTVLSAISVLLYFVLFVASNRKTGAVGTNEVRREQLNSDPYAPPGH